MRILLYICIIQRPTRWPNVKFMPSPLGSLRTAYSFYNGYFLFQLLAFKGTVHLGVSSLDQVTFRQVIFYMARFELPDYFSWVVKCTGGCQVSCKEYWEMYPSFRVVLCLGTNQGLSYDVIRIQGCRRTSSFCHCHRHWPFSNSSPPETLVLNSHVSPVQEHTF